MPGLAKDGPERYLAGLARFGWRLGLERIERLLDGLGHPERAFSAVQVAGTNGKGSTSATLAHVLAAAGYRTGLYTSPHLESYRERLVIVERRPPGGRSGRASLRRRLISSAGLASALRQVMAVADRVAGGPAGPPTEFEVLTAAAVHWFAQERVDIAVLEAGLGGRLDATTAVPAVLSVLTHIDLDHADRLGPTLDAIAAEKAAIIRPGRPVVVAPQAAEARAVIDRRAATVRAPVLAVVEGLPGGTSAAGYAVEGIFWDHTAFTYFPAGGPPRTGLRTALSGRHQAANAATALAAAQALAAEGFPVGEEAVREGLSAVRWPGRFEVLRREPPVVVDGAHNPDGLRRLGETWRELSPGVAPVVVCGFLKDKAVEEMVEIICGLAGEAVVTRPASDRAADPGPVADAFLSRGIRAQAVADPRQAARLALARPEAAGGVLGCGSLYLAGVLRREWRRLCRKGGGLR